MTDSNTGSNTVQPEQGKSTPVQPKKYHPFFDKLQVLWRAFRENIRGAIHTAFPEATTRRAFLALIVFGELFLIYMIAVIDYGMWIGDCSPIGMIRGYATERTFPFVFTIILCLTLLGGVYIYLNRFNNGNTGRGFEVADTNTYGSARDITTEEIESVAQIVPKEAALGTILCQLDETEQKLVCVKPVPNPNYNGNILVFGPPGSGKSFCFVKPYILQAIRRRESVICTDTKGELWADTVEFARLHGYIVRRIDFKDVAYSAGWNVLSELRGDDMRSLIFAQIIMKNTGDENDIHASAEESLLRAICLYQERSLTIPPEEKTLYNAFAMLLEGAEALDKTFNSIKFDPNMRIAYEAYATALKGSPNQRNNVVSNLANRLSVLSSPPLREMTSTPEIDMTLPAQKPCIYYINMSDQHETMKFMASLFFSFSFLDLVDYADAQPNRKCPVPVTFLMEEFANLGEVPNITKYLKTCRSRAINIALVVQSLGDLKEIYGENRTNSILSTCATHVCIGFNDQETADYYCWRSGTATVRVMTEQHRMGEGPINFGRGYSTGDGRREMFTAHELMTIATGKVFISWQRYDCLLAHTFGVNRHLATLQGQMNTISTETRIRLSNAEAKAYFLAAEEQRVADYEEWVRQGGNPWKGYSTPKPEYSGKMSGTDLPPITPYEQLEAEALAHSKQATPESPSALKYEIQQPSPVQHAKKETPPAASQKAQPSDTTPADTASEPNQEQTDITQSSTLNVAEEVPAGTVESPAALRKEYSKPRCEIVDQIPSDMLAAMQEVRTAHDDAPSPEPVSHLPTPPAEAPHREPMVAEEKIPATTNKQKKSSGKTGKRGRPTTVMEAPARDPFLDFDNEDENFRFPKQQKEGDLFGKETKIHR